MGMTINAINLALVFYATSRFHATPTQIGVLYGVYNFSYMLACLLFKQVLQRVKPQSCVLIATTGLLLGLLGIYFSPSLGPAYAFQALCGLSTALFWPPLMGWLTEGYEGSRLGRITGLYNLCWSSGAIIGPLLAGLLGSGSSSRPLRYCIAAHAALLVFLWFSNRRQPSHHAVNLAATPPPTGPAVVAPSPASQGQESSMRYPCWFGGLCAWATAGMLLNIYPLFAQDELALSKPIIGTLLFVRALAMTCAMSLLGFIKRWHFNPAQLLAGHALLAVAVLCLGLTTNIHLIMVLLAICGIFAGHAYTNSMFHGVSGCSNRTFRMAIHEVVLATGAVFGSVMSGQIYQRLGSSTLFLCTALFMLPAILVDILWWRKARS